MGCVKDKKTGAGVKKTPATKKHKIATKKKIPNIVDVFKSKKIPVYKPGEEDYQRSIATANRLFRFSRPACVVQSEHTAHVEFIVKQAKLQNIPITIKNGGHSYSGSSIANKGILLDLVKMNEVHLDMDSKTVKLQGGALWGNAYKQLIKDHHDGYIINGGRCPTVGVSGYILGGGLGPFTRSFGMGCDSLMEATIVTAEGSAVTVKHTDDPKSPEGKLFWALCGAGGANFGVVVELKMIVDRLENRDGIVVAGRFVWNPEEDKIDLLKTMNRFYLTDWSNQMTIDSTWLCDLRMAPGKLGVRFTVYFDGNKHDFDKQINRSVAQKELASLFERRTKAEKSTQLFYESLDAQWKEETKKAFPESKSWTIYSSFVFENDPVRIESVTAMVNEELEVFRNKFKGEQVLAQATFIHSGGQAAKKQRSDTAFHWREAVYHAYIMIQWDDKWMERDMRDFCKAFKARLRPFSTKGRAAFINFPDGALGTEAYERAYYGNNRKKLQLVKQIWDEDNFFEWPQGIRLPNPNEQSPSGLPNFTTSTARGRNVGTAFISGDEESSGEEFSGEEDNDVLPSVTYGEQWENYSLPSTDDFVGMHGIPYWWWV
ncbi:hypothetical protein EG329_006356 [Mollisiaceae sp. DMI_Dod_QoI]|nr:hypothetical protein EG329_006356 [Helotiales sp. DMI_Dod_QoI]